MYWITSTMKVYNQRMILKGRKVQIDFTYTCHSRKLVSMSSKNVTLVYMKLLIFRLQYMIELQWSRYESRDTVHAWVTRQGPKVWSARDFCHTFMKLIFVFYKQIFSPVTVMLWLNWLLGPQKKREKEREKKPRE